MQLDDEIVDVTEGVCIVIPPGVRHRAIGKMKVLIFVLPKFDANDEWVVEEDRSSPDVPISPSSISLRDITR